MLMEGSLACVIDLTLKPHVYGQPTGILCATYQLPEGWRVAPLSTYRVHSVA